MVMACSWCPHQYQAGWASDGGLWRTFRRLKDLADQNNFIQPEMSIKHGTGRCSCTHRPWFVSFCGVIFRAIEFFWLQIILTLGVSYASVPLYRAFCAATGFAGTPQVGTGRFDAERMIPVEGSRKIKIHFNADKSNMLPWSFTPQQKFVVVMPGETSLAFYKAKNNSNKDIIGIATYNVTPDRVGVVIPFHWWEGY